MHLITDTSALRDGAATIGFFDGVHAGHACLLAQLSEVAHGRPTLAVTFDEHPRRVLQASFRPLSPPLLTPLSDKIRLLASTGIDGCALLHFSPALAALSAREFMERVLRDQLGVRLLLVGYDHRFGAGRKEGFGDYASYGRALGMEVAQARPLYAAKDGTPVSSSAVRRALSAGDADRATCLLGRPYEVRGEVVEGHHLGRRIGFPTANLRPSRPDQLIPAPGVYLAEARLAGTGHPAMVSIGTRPTLNNGTDTTIEAHLPLFNGWLYGTLLTLRFFTRLRDEEKFPSVEALKAQLRRDREACLAFYVAQG